ncbi:hypothetical protein [Agrococcus sp. HG114]|uniref:hypothetical protein n=1 Tax=Agrococcus sp. HG114 TaxID=2969757 RepID=UPI00215AEB50|nr:hypothetical protein [Agrococcus sp. HG114]MCR8670034.1 hypothetical protein [Agrococcus sp. HG114]
MEPWFSSVASDPTWIVIVGVIAAIGSIATVVVLIVQREPRRKPDLERIARRREPRAAH